MEKSKGVLADSAIRAQAAVWLARLRSEHRTLRDEAGLRAWLSQDVRHQQAFDRVTAVWEAAGSFDRFDFPAPKPKSRVLSAPVLVAATLVVMLLGVGVLTLAFGFAPTRTYTTGVGELRRVALSDGSVLELDANTTVTAAMRRTRRELAVLNGRAHFEVAHNAARPFIVTSGRQQVVALGTAFDVSYQRTQDHFSVLLLTGRIVVNDAGSTSGGQRLRAAGDRLTVAGGKRTLDRPDMAQATAWQSGRAIFQNASLTDAVASMNQYSRRQLVIADPALAKLRVSGVYSLGDSEAFGRSLSVLLPLKTVEQPEQIVLRPAQ